MSAIEWLGCDHDEPGAFERPPSAAVHTPTGLYSIKPNHPADCLCETGEGEFWLQADTIMKWSR